MARYLQPTTIQDHARVSVYISASDCVCHILSNLFTTKAEPSAKSLPSRSYRGSAPLLPTKWRSKGLAHHVRRRVPGREHLESEGAEAAEHWGDKLTK